MKKLFKYQLYHLLGYIVLGTILVFYSKVAIKTQDSVWNLTAFDWVLLSWIAAGIFQAWVLLFWRLEFHFKKISQWFGKSGFLIFRIGFIILGTIRMFPVIPISFLTEQTLELNNYLQIILIVGTTPLILWAIYSVFFYFGLYRAFGADHFFEEYKTKSLEKRGTFKYFSNSMYTIVLLLLYHPGLFFDSSLGLVTALIHHLFVWIHYFCTEKVDLAEIYAIKQVKN